MRSALKARRRLPLPVAAPVRSDRDLVGDGRSPPRFEWPGGAAVVLNVVLVYEEGSEYSVLWGDDRNDGWGEYAGAGVDPPQRDRHRVALRVRQPRRRLAPRADLRPGRNPRHGLGRGGRARAESRGRGLDAGAG